MEEVVIMLKMSLLLLTSASLLACTDTYHPEYHPVTVTTVQQSTNGPTVTGPSGPLVVAPARTGVTPLVIQDPALANPDAFFAAQAR